jgi:chromosome partitioning protein
MKNKTTVISILNQKGGVGKTTLCNNLGKAFKNIGKSVLLIDSDPQGSLRDWNEANDGSVLPVLGMDRETLPTDLKAIKSGYDIIIIDGAPQSSKLASAGVKSSDIVLIPTTPSPYDVWASADLVDIVKARQEVMNGKPISYFAISKARKNTKLGNEIYDAIKEYDLPVLKNGTTDLEVYKQTASKGETVFVDKDAKNAINEVNGIRDEIMEVINAKS